MINSCTVTGIADKKSRNFARRSKRINPNAVTALIGCYAEVAGDALADIPEIDIILGTTEKENFPDVLDKYFAKNEIVRECTNESDTSHCVSGKDLKKNTEFDSENTSSLPAEIPKLQARSRTYLKIEDGCDRFCSYCIIPYARGAVRSRAPEDILEEAKGLVDKGFKEIILTGINTALYGKDFSGSRASAIVASAKSGVAVLSSFKDGFASANISDASEKDYFGEAIIDIVNKIAAIDGDFRIRLSSLEPTVVNADCVKELIKCDKLCSHLHLSLQSGSDRVLSAMKRRYSMEEYLNIVNVVKSKDSNYALSTDIIVGFPGESEEDFECSMNAVKTIGFSKIHVFKYSPRKGTAAAEMNDKVSEEDKNKRSKLLIAVGEESVAKFLAQNKGLVRQTLFFNKIDDSNLYRGLTDNDIEFEYASERDISNSLIDIVIK